MYFSLSDTQRDAILFLRYLFPPEFLGFGSVNKHRKGKSYLFFWLSTFTIANYAFVLFIFKLPHSIFEISPPSWTCGGPVNPRWRLSHYGASSNGLLTLRWITTCRYLLLTTFYRWHFNCCSAGASSCLSRRQLAQKFNWRETSRNALNGGRLVLITSCG